MKKVCGVPLFLLSCLLLAFTSCTISKQVAKKANNHLFKDSAISKGHIGISIFEPATGKYWYNHDAEKYFVPASNTKLFSLYAGLRYLGDSIVGIQYIETPDSIILQGTGDPTFLHAGFSKQPVFSFLKNVHKKIAFRINARDNFRPLGYGWAWDDYESSYMVERSALPIYGNVITFRLAGSKLQSVPSSFAENFDMVIPSGANFEIHRNENSNKFYLANSRNKFTSGEIPFKTSKSTTAMEMLLDSLGLVPSSLQVMAGLLAHATKIHSGPTDSLFIPMMHRSDNFFAEQTLLMVSNEKLGYLSDKDIIDTILKTDLKDIPQKPKWVDGSGLSRYNLFTPQSFVYILNKMRNDFGWERMKTILPTGGEGTISSYYKKDAGFLFAKTGTLSNNCALSGYLVTKKNKVLIFSVLANNYQTSATPVRRAVEKFLQDIRDKY